MNLFRSDTANGYRNELLIGDALQTLLPKYGLKREDIFITSKLVPRKNEGHERVIETVKQSIKDLQTDYIDLYLIHWPGVMGIPVESAENSVYRKSTWNALVQCKREGLLRSIGVSNYNIKHLEDLLAVCSDDIRPAVNQVEWHPHYHQPELLDFCRRENIFLQAYSSLGSSGTRELRSDSTVNFIARKNKRSASQVLLRWAFQQGIGILPKARSKEHIDENVDLDFELSAEDMRALSTLQTSNKYAWNPETVA